MLILYLGDVIDENCFHNCVGELEKTLLVPVSTKGITVDHENWIEQHSKQDSFFFKDFIHSCIISNTCLYNIFETYLSKFILKLSLKHANNVLKLPGVDNVAKKLGTSHNVKGFGIGLFLECIVVERAK